MGLTGGGQMNRQRMEVQVKNKIQLRVKKQNREYLIIDGSNVIWPVQGIEHPVQMELTD